MSIPEISGRQHLRFELDSPDTSVEEFFEPELTIEEASSHRTPQIENRDALTFSRHRSSPDFYPLFQKIRTASRHHYPPEFWSIGESIFGENVETFGNLHDTPLDEIEKKFAVYFDRYNLSADRREAILKVLSVTFYTSVQNSSLGLSAKTLDRFIEEYLPKTKKNHFQAIIQKAKEALEKSNRSSDTSLILKELRDATFSVDSLLKLYGYIEGRDSHLLKDLIFFNTAQYDVSPPFSLARLKYHQFRQSLLDRKLDSPLEEISNQLRKELKKASKRESQLTSDQQERANFCSIERDAIWTASIKLLETVYQNRHINKETPNEQSLYEWWSRESDLPAESILEKFISQMPEETFQSISKKLKKHHPLRGDDTISTKTKRVEILLTAFIDSFQISSRFDSRLKKPTLLTLYTLKKWCKE